MVNTASHAHLELRSSNSKHYTLSTSKVSYHVSNLKETVEQSKLATNKIVPFSLLSNEDWGDQHRLPAFALAPKLSKNCHELPGLLSEKTKDSRCTWHKEFLKTGNYWRDSFLHESVKYTTNISANVVFKKQR